MAIADKLQAVLNSKNDIKEALTEKDQSPTDVFSTYANLIRNIETSVDGESITEELNEQTATADELVAIAKRKYFETLNAGIYVWKKLTAEGGDFIEYVVSGESTTYPDGGEQDGYWYEMVEEGAFKITHGTITISNTYSLALSIAHNLGVSPEIFLLLPEPETITVESDVKIGFAYYAKGFPAYMNNSYTHGICVENPANKYTVTAGTYYSITVDASTISFGTAAYGIGTYKWIAIA